MWIWHQLQIARAKSILTNINGFTPAFSFVGGDGCAIALDETRRRIGFLDRYGDSWIYAYSEILDLQIAKNGISFTKTNRGRQLASAFAGKFLFGDKGFLIGGNTASTTMSERIRRLTLKVFIRDMKRPVWEITFYSGSPIEEDNRRLKKAATALDEWYGRVRAAIG
jgi:hypothetical protein